MPAIVPATLLGAAVFVALTGYVISLIEDIRDALTDDHA